MADAAEPVARRFIDALMAGARGAVPMTPEAVLWHNTDGVEAPLATAFDSFAAIRSQLPDFCFDEVCVSVGDMGRSTAQYVFTVSLPDGASLRVPACSVFTEKGGLLDRVEEYIDSARLAPIIAALGIPTDG